MTWGHYDTWVVIVGTLSATSCALLGNYLVLRRMSMMGDAISHAVLPGLAIAFLITGSRDSVPMFAGAAIVGVLTAVFTQWVHTFGKLDQNASMGVVFTTLFAIGLLLIVRALDEVHIDAGCVLYGAIEFTPLGTVTVLGFENVPRAAVTLGGVLVVDIVIVILLYKELKISAFDPALATTLGIHANAMLYLLMGLVAMLVTSDGDSSTDDSRDKLFAGCLVAGITFAVLVARKMFESRPAVEKSPVPVPATVNVQSDSPGEDPSSESGKQEIEGDGPGGGEEADEGRDS